MNTTTTMATPMVSFDSVFHMLSEKVTFFTFIKGNKVFGFWMVIPSQKSKNMNHLKPITVVSMETKFASQDSILDKLSEKLYLSRFWEGEQGFYKGGHFVPPPPPPLPAGAPKKPALDRVKGE